MLQSSNTNALVKCHIWLSVYTDIFFTVALKMSYESWRKIHLKVLPVNTKNTDSAEELKTSLPRRT